MLKFILYMLLAVVILSGGIFKTFAINYGISKYLSKKPYKGDFEFKKVALHTLETNYILLALVVLIVLGITLCSASSYINIVENLVELILGFFIALVISLLGPWYNTIGNEYGAYVIPFFILVIISIPMLFLINYKFVYKDFEVSKNKRIKLSLFTALANAPYEFLIPYGMIV
ncbi:MAG TPA: hypothetical protein PKW74_04510, partial [Ruminococcus bromii]|nr:hypothetical protein [Ruminococcus bromii]